MATFAELQSAVSERLLDPSGTAVSPANVAASINDSIAYWKFRRFWFNEGVFTSTLTQQDPILPLPSDFLVPAFDDGAVTIEYSAMRYPLNKISNQTFNQVFLTNGYGLPVSYARVGNGYRVYFIPDRNYDFLLYYLKDYVPLVANGDTNDFTDNAARLLTLWSCANCIAEFREDEKMEAYFRKAANDEALNLGRMTNKSNSTGKLAINSVL